MSKKMKSKNLEMIQLISMGYTLLAAVRRIIVTIIKNEFSIHIEPVLNKQVFLKKIVD